MKWLRLHYWYGRRHAALIEAVRSAIALTRANDAIVNQLWARSIRQQDEIAALLQQVADLELAARDAGKAAVH